MKQEGHPKEVRLNDKGANQDVDKAIVGADIKSGEYIEGRNLRVSSVKSKRLSAEKIFGEKLIHSNTLPGNYVSLVSESINNQKIEIWVDSNSNEPPVIIIDGVIVAKSSNIPFLVDFPIQHDINESCIGGEIFLTDNNTTPVIFSIKDMLDSLINNPTKYFQDFNINLYSVNLNIDLSIPIFKELVNVGGTSGLPIGSYSYSFRYVTISGDRTDWTPSTPLIPIVDNLSSDGSTFPWVRTFGGPPNPSVGTNFGIKIRFRVNNTSNFDFLEVRRQAWNSGVGGVLSPNSIIVAKIDLFDNEIGIKEFIDPADSNVSDAISEEDEVNKLSLIKRAKAIRYHDKRLVLMNVEFEDKNSDNITFDTINGKPGVPIVKSLGKSGHKDPFDHTYNKRYMGGEKFGFGVALFGSVGGSSFVKPIPGLTNFEFPNRRDPVSADGKLLSYTGMPSSPTVTGVVDNTFEIFDLENPVNKTDICSYKNILEAGDKSRSACAIAGCSEDHGVRVSGTDIGYLPYTPVSKDDIDISGLNYRVNIEADNGNSDVDYNPLGFAPNYFTNGLAIAGVGNLPNWVKGFSVVRTEAAGRVIASGIGMYSLIEGDFNFVGNASLLSKEKRKIWFHAADLETVNSNLIQSIKDNPNDFKIQVVSAMGFFSELYQYEQNTLQGDRDRIVDLMTYARVTHDNGRINPTESPGMGVGDQFGRRHVCHNKYRNKNDTPVGGIFNGDGNKLIDMAGFKRVTINDSDYFEIEFNSDFYNHKSIGGNGEKDFNDDGLQQWTEPFYVVNIIDVGAEIRDSNINNYKSTGHFQKIESTIGKGDGLPDQSFELVDERWEDCIPDLSSTGNFSTTNSYAYISDVLGIQKRWMNVTFKTNIDINNISNDIINNGFHEPVPGTKVYGLYTHTNSNNRDFNLVFNINPFYPGDNDFILVKYDDSRPISVFGGDTIVGEQVFCPIDGVNENDDVFQADKMFVFNAGFPMRKYRMNPRHFVVRNGSATFNKIQDNSEASLGLVRQLTVCFYAESRAAINYTHNVKGDSSAQSYPLINYVMRPNEWNGTGLSPNNIFEEYGDDYGNEGIRWTKGGFRYKQQTNPDYTFDGLIQFFSKPQFGFEEITEFCTAIIWSISRAINVQDSPGLKTFTSGNRKDIADDQGEIKKAYDATTGGKGENLYAITEKGICLLLTKKSILSNIDSDDLTTVSTDEFISGEYWLSKEIGSNDEFWRGMGERTIGFPTEKGSIQKEILFIPNRESIFSLVDNQIKDILRPSYHSRVVPFLKSVKPGYESFMTGFINNNNNEYWIDIEGVNKLNAEDVTPERKLFVYGNENGLWEGYFDYSFDKYFMSKNEIYASRDLKTFRLENGFQINSSNIVYELTTAFSPGNVSLEKEFIRIGIQTGSRKGMKPTKVEFYDEEMNLLCSLNSFSQGSLFLKQYDGWEQFIGRKDLVASQNRDRVQYRTLVVKVIHDLPEDFRIVSTTIQYKVIK